MAHSYVTTPLYYVNADPHLGHVYTTIVADVWARYRRWLGHEVFFSTGTDEHGQKVAEKAKEHNQTPQEHVNHYSQVFRAMTRGLNATCDDFIRTTEVRHHKAAAAFWKNLEESGFIYKGSYEGWYALRDEAFYKEADLVDGRAPTGAEVQWMSEECYFFALSKFQDPLLEWYKTHPISPASRQNEVIEFVKKGLRDLAVSRSSLTWGIPVPGHESHVMYVWIEALVNYLTVLDYPNTQSSKMQNFWPQAVHIMGKDIITFHGVYWPAFLMAANLPLPKKIHAHGWWMVGEEKMSKSLGNTVSWKETLKYGEDPLRYFLLSHTPFGEDGRFSFSALEHCINTDLANVLGNAVHRVLSFLHKNHRGCIPGVKSFDPTPLSQWQEESDTKLHSFMEHFQLHSFAGELWKGLRLVNQYIDQEKPWACVGEIQGHILRNALECLRYIGLWLRFFLPTTSETMLNLLGVPTNERSQAYLHASLHDQVSLPTPTVLFQKTTL